MSISFDIKNISYGKKEILKNVSGKLSCGRVTALIGKNGSGKTTLLLALAGLVECDGTITLDGADIRALTNNERARRISIMLQHTEPPHLTVRELVSYGRHPYTAPLGKLTDEDNRKVEAAIRDAELEAFAERYVDELSGGEMRRVYFALLLAQGTKNILLDEPTAFMDMDYEDLFLKKLRELSRRDGVCTLAAVHNVNAAIRYADDIILLEGGGIKYFGSTEALLKTDVIESAFSLLKISHEDDTLYIPRR